MLHICRDLSYNKLTSLDRQIFLSLTRLTVLKVRNVSIHSGMKISCHEMIVLNSIVVQSAAIKDMSRSYLCDHLL